MLRTLGFIQTIQGRYKRILSSSSTLGRSIKCDLEIRESTNSVHGTVNEILPQRKKSSTSGSSKLVQARNRLNCVQTHILKCAKSHNYQDFDENGIIQKNENKCLVIARAIEPPDAITTSLEQYQMEKGTKKRLSKKLIKKGKFGSSEERFEHLNSIFKAFIEVNISTGEYSNALKVFDYIKEQVEESCVLNLSVYHSLLSCATRLRNIDELKKVWGYMINDNIQPDARCFMAAFQCVGSTKEDNCADVIKFSKSLEEDMLDKGFSFDELFWAGESHFVDSEDRMLLLDGVRTVQSSFNPKTSPGEYRPRLYNNELLEDLDVRDTSHLKSPLSGIMSDKKLEECFERQIQFETERYVPIPSLIRNNFKEEEILLNRKAMNQLCNQWREKLITKLTQRMDLLTTKSHHERSSDRKSFHIQHFLRALSIEDLSDICVQEVRKILGDSERHSPSVTTMQRQLGEEVMKKYHLNMRTKDLNHMVKYTRALKSYLKWVSNPTNSDSWCPREAYDVIISEMNYGPSLHVVPSDWPFPVLIALGRELFHVIMDKIQYREDDEGNIVIHDNFRVKIKSDGSTEVVLSDNKARNKFPGLFKIYARMGKNGHCTEEIKPHPRLAKLFAMQKYDQFMFPVDQLPMLVPPLPWSSPNQGGYFLHPSDLIRIAGFQVSPQFTKIMDERNQNITPVFDSLDLLGITPWIVNKPILDIVIHAFVNQEKYGPFLKKMGVPTHPELVEIPELRQVLKEKIRSKKLTTEEMNEYRTFMKLRQEALQKKSDSLSLWSDTLYRLSIADYFREDICFFPHNIDFRGRVYPLPPHFNHMGGDLVRSLLIFAEGKPLGPDGLRWLKLHVVNLTGTKKKSSVAERLEYAEQILDIILDSAENPFEGQRWWLESEDPLQTLATCMEIRNALRFEKESVNQSAEGYVCHLPIHQDGSCNGLQHYAALGRDVLGAASVNLIPADKPQDVYNEIATIVERKRVEDEKEGDEIATLLNGFVRRKVIKQTVMTTVYGVTAYGAKLQIARQLEDLDDFPQESKEIASKYLAKKTFESLNEMFTASQEIQTWLTECAHVISGTLLKTVEWETPLGLSVAQPYMKRLSTPVTMDKRYTNSMDIRRLMMEKIVKEKPNSRKQQNGFPPNFVHSLDSSHMMLTSLYMWNSGFTYASVHDCYWTHACNVPPMNEICRKQFVNLHSQPILESLAQSFVTNLLGNDENVKADGVNALPPANTNVSAVDKAKAQILFENVPQKGNDTTCLNLNIVKKSVYFFS